MEKIKKQLFKLNRELRRMEAEGKMVKADPMKLLNEMEKEDEKNAKAAAKGANSVEDSDASPLFDDPGSPLKTAQPTTKQLEKLV